jgi:hypothetical protein
MILETSRRPHFPLQTFLFGIECKSAGTEVMVAQPCIPLPRALVLEAPWCTYSQPIAIFRLRLLGWVRLSGPWYFYLCLLTHFRHVYFPCIRGTTLSIPVTRHLHLDYLLSYLDLSSGLRQQAPKERVQVPSETPNRQRTYITTGVAPVACVASFLSALLVLLPVNIHDPTQLPSVAKTQHLRL